MPAVFISLGLILSAAAPGANADSQALASNREARPAAAADYAPTDLESVIAWEWGDVSREPLEPDTPPRAAIDPRVELLQVIQGLAGEPAVNALDSPYHRDAANHFRPYGNHAAVRRLRRMAEAGFRFDAPLRILLRLSMPPELEPRAPFDEADVCRAGGQRAVEHWVRDLRRFARDSRFVEFLAREELLLAASVHSQRARQPTAPLVRVLKEYLGRSPVEYRIVLAPRGSGNYGITVPGSEASRTYGVGGGIEARADTVGFGTPAQYRWLIWHETTHPVVNACIISRAREVDDLSALFEPLREAMATHAYADWSACLEEHVVRAITVRLTARQVSENAARAIRDWEVGQGFTHLDTILKVLESVEAEAGTLAPFDSTFLRILGALGGVQP